MKKSVLLIIIFLATTISAFSEDLIDVIYLKDSTVIEGYIIQQEPNKPISLQLLNGDFITIDYEKVVRITKKDKSKYYYNLDYFEAGINLGTPGGVNLLVGKWFSPIGIKVSGMNLGKIYGIQGNLMYKISDDYNTCHSLGLSTGVSHMELEKTDIWGETETEIYDWQYYGVVYNLNWSGFWLEAGLCGGTGDFTSPQLMAQIGFTYRFIDY
ncbi:MAG: hypothetical protein V1779_10125 [bacterium]